MLGAVRTLGFSETARSCPCHDKARRGLNRFLAGSVFARRHLNDAMERPAECAQAREADIETDVRDASVGLSQHEHGALDAPALQITVRRLAKRRPKGANEMGLGDARDLCERRHVERVSEGAIDRIPRSK